MEYRAISLLSEQLILISKKVEQVKRILKKLQERKRAALEGTGKWELSELLQREREILDICESGEETIMQLLPIYTSKEFRAELPNELLELHDKLGSYLSQAHTHINSGIVTWRVELELWQQLETADDAKRAKIMQSIKNNQESENQRFEDLKGLLSLEPFFAKLTSTVSAGKMPLSMTAVAAFVIQAVVMPEIAQSPVLLMYEMSAIIIMFFLVFTRTITESWYEEA